MQIAGGPPWQADFAAVLQHYNAGRPQQALLLLRKVIAANPKHVDALHYAGIVLAQHGDAVEGERLIAAALALKDDVAFIWSNHGNALRRLGRNGDALASYARAIEIDPNHADTFYNRANALMDLGSADEALADFRRAVELAPQHPHMIVGPGNALLKLEGYEDAISEFDRVLAAKPGQVDAIVGRSVALKELDRFEEALAGFDKALSMVQGYVPALLGRADTLIRLNRPAEPLPLLNKIVEQLPGNAEAWYMRGLALLAMSDLSAALDNFQRAASLKSGFVEAEYNAADVLRALGREAQASELFKSVLERQPGHAHALAGLATCAMQSCDWETTRKLAPRLEEKVRSGSRGLLPFSFLSLSTSKELQLACAQNFVKHSCPDPGVRLHRGEAKRRERIRLGYLSSDFRAHATPWPSRWPNCSKSTTGPSSR